LVELQRRNSTFCPTPQRLSHCGVLNVYFWLEHRRNSRKRPVVVTLRNSLFPPSCGAATRELEKVELPRIQKNGKIELRSCARRNSTENESYAELQQRGVFSSCGAQTKTEIQYAAVLSTLGEKDLEKSSCAAESSTKNEETRLRQPEKMIKKR